ncbi:MAG: glycosyltransferase [Gammaproteobacteria bacterium]
MTKSASKANIAYLTGFYARAGDTFIRREVEELRRQGWKVKTFSIRRADSSEQVSEDILREQASTQYILEQGIWCLAAAFSRMAWKYPVRMLRAINLARQIRWPGFKSVFWHLIYLVEAAYLAEQLIKNDIKLLHNHIAMNTGTVAMLVSALSGIPYSMTVHGPHEFFEAERWGLGKKIAASSLTVCISHFGKSQCMLFSPREEWTKLHVIHCGLDSVFFDDAVSKVTDSRKLIYVGRLDPEKGFFVLLDAAARISEAGIDFELLIVGDGAVRAEGEAYAEQLNLQDSVHFLGWRSSREVQQLISECRALVLPSFAEGIPVVLMEAMASQRPVITTQIAGIPELVRNGENGWLVAASSVDDLANAIREVLQAPPEVLEAMGRKGRLRVLEQHSIGTEVAKLSALFGNVVCASRRTTAASGPAAAVELGRE